MKKHWKQILWAGICAMCLAGFGLLRLGDSRTAENLTTQQAAMRWQTPEKPYQMVSAFLERENAIPAGRTDEIRLQVEKDLSAGGVPASEYPWLYGFSCQEEAVLRNGKASSAAVLTRYQGDFFQIHPMVLLRGSYPEPDEIMRDRIVLNRKAAWDLFASDNAAGQYLELEGRSFLVAAVADREPGRDSARADGDLPRAWIFWDALPEEEVAYTSVEMVLPQPVRDFAASTLRSACQIPENVPLVENSLRFRLKNRWRVLRSLGTRSLSNRAVAYPAWENAARLAENRLAWKLIPEGLLLLAPVLSLLLLLWRWNRRRTWGLHSLKELGENMIDKKRQRDYQRLDRRP